MPHSGASPRNYIRRARLIMAVVVVVDRRPEEGIKSDIRTTYRRAARRPRSLWAAPVILDRVDCARTHRGLIKGADIAHANFVSPQIVQVDLYFRRGIHRNVNVLVADHIVGNYGSVNGRAATAAVDVDSPPAWRCRVVQIREIFRNVVADDYVVVE